MQNFKSNSLPINDFKYSEAILYGLLGTYSEAATTASTQGLRDYTGVAAIVVYDVQKVFYERESSD